MSSREADIQKKPINFRCVQLKDISERNTRKASYIARYYGLDIHLVSCNGSSRFRDPSGNTPWIPCTKTHRDRNPDGFWSAVSRDRDSHARREYPFRLVAACSHTRSNNYLAAWLGGNAELMLPLAIPLHAAGFNVLLLDARNHGHSDSASFSSLPRFAEDVAEAIDWVKKQSKDQTDRIVLLGHSVGGGAVLFEASRRCDIAAVISIATFAHPEWMMRRYLGRFGMPNLFTTWILRYIEWIIGHSYEEIAPLYTACRINCPVLLIHGTADATVPVTDALVIRDHCSKNSLELLLIENADHESVEVIEKHAGQLLSFLTRAGVLG